MGRDVDSFKKLMAIVKILRDKRMRHRHWKVIKEITTESFDQESLLFNLEFILKLNLENI